MLKIGLILMMMPNFFNGLFGSYDEHVHKIDQDLIQAEKTLDEGDYQTSFEKTKDAEDEFNYIWTSFPKKEQQKWVDLMDQFEEDISILNIQKSKHTLMKIDVQWEQLKKMP